MAIEALQQGCEKKYSLKKIYNIYVKIAQAHFIYQPSKAKAIIAMPFDWLEVQNLLEDYLKKHGADFDALSKEYISESAEDDYLPSAQLETIICSQCVHYQQNHHYCEFLDAEFSPSDYCSYAERDEE